jgi:general secretion pathway protein G
MRKVGVSAPSKAGDVRRGQRGLTFVELTTALAVLVVLAGAAIPVLRWNEKRRLEVRLRGDLQTMRDAIDQYHKYAVRGLIEQTDVMQVYYPRTLDEMVDGVDVGPTTAEGGVPKTIKFLTRIPVDPMTGEAEWGLRSYQDDFDSTSWGEENVYDVYSLSDGVALDGTYYKDW